MDPNAQYLEALGGEESPDISSAAIFFGIIRPREEDEEEVDFRKVDDEVGTEYFYGR